MRLAHILTDDANNRLIIDLLPPPIQELVLAHLFLVNCHRHGLAVPAIPGVIDRVICLIKQVFVLPGMVRSLEHLTHFIQHVIEIQHVLLVCIRYFALNQILRKSPLLFRVLR